MLEPPPGLEIRPQPLRSPGVRNYRSWLETRAFGNFQGARTDTLKSGDSTPLRHRIPRRWRGNRWRSPKKTTKHQRTHPLKAANHILVGRAHTGQTIEGTESEIIVSSTAFVGKEQCTLTTRARSINEKSTPANLPQRTSNQWLVPNSMESGVSHPEQGERTCQATFSSLLRPTIAVIGHRMFRRLPTCDTADCRRRYSGF